MAIGQKFALLIGVGDYAEDSGLKGLSTPARNVAALAEVLGNEAVGGFAVTTLLNPTLEGMSKAVSALTYGRSPEDLLLLYFSGHGVKDEMGGLYFSNCKTRKHPDGTLDKGTAMGAATLKDMLSSRIHRRMIVILDCCFGGAFSEGFLTMDDGRVGLEDALGGKGLVVLTAADSMVYALEKPDDDLSIYTRYVHEGLTTGAAASEGSEWISARMLHEYVAERIRQGGYAMKPEIYVEKDGCGIYVARAKPGDPEVRYRRECAKYFDDSLGRFPLTAVRLLERKAVGLGIAQERAAELREAVRRPWVEYRENLREYRLALAEDLTHYGMQLPEVVWRALADLRQELSLQDEDAHAIEAELMTALSTRGKQGSKPVAMPILIEPGRDEVSQHAIEKTPLRYQKLEKLLALGDWKGANEETQAVILWITQREEDGWLDTDDIKQFPCEDLLTIDRLWTRYSDGKFGFSIQREICVNCGATLDGKYPDDGVEALGEAVGWRVLSEWITESESEVTLSRTTPVPCGYLPCVWLVPVGGGFGVGVAVGTILFSRRLTECEI